MFSATTLYWKKNSRNILNVDFYQITQKYSIAISYSLVYYVISTSKNLIEIDIINIKTYKLEIPNSGNLPPGRNA